MKLLKLYEWIAGNMTDFLSQFQNNESLYQQARVFWNKLEGISTIIICLVLLGALIAFLYYKPYNNVPGRHYTPKHWIWFLIVTFVVTSLLTLVFEYIAVEPVLKGALLLETKIALGNGVYASAVYFIVSVLWCDFLPTNAYRLFKF
ncbi:MAG: hypothetical protein IKW93_08175 [Bacteroidales bacterium]|nr:hypothetical protein [Bacteroidales bacterium]